MKDESIFELCASVLTRLGFGGESLVSLIQKWRFFIEECKDGYRWDYSEYLNDIRCRSLLQRLLEEPKIASADEFKEIFYELACLDDMFKSLLQPDLFIRAGEKWWERGVLIRAGEEYCFYMKAAHGIVVENIGC
ncbi:hypothetical protein [Pseudomonas sp. 1152_12]|uniref:hypothetical protein n=1 Tax=Pseudomonas sp. 1152_12 TaxID=2604455 RepID=UPI0040631B1D